MTSLSSNLRALRQRSVAAPTGAALVAGLLLLAACSRDVKEVSSPPAATVVEQALAQPKEKAATGLDPALREEDRRLAARLIALAHDQPEIGQRMKTISAQLLGRPYRAHPLIGSPVVPERFVARMDSFDCVTFLETVLALGGSYNVDDFLNRLRRIRYEDGVISYSTRLHYMTDWNDSNVRRGFLLDLTHGPGTIEQAKRLDVVAGLQPHPVILRYFPRQQIGAAGHWLHDGDVIGFVSARKGLDTFHVGLVFRDGERVLLRHASLSNNRVLDERLAGFAGISRMPGFIVTRPADVPPVPSRPPAGKRPRA